MPEPDAMTPKSEADGGHGGGGHGGPRVDDAVIPWRIFLAIGVLVGVLAAIYWFTAYEDAGTVMLGLTAVLALWCGAFLWLQWRHLRKPVSPDHPVEDEYEPHASAWPFVIGLGAATAANGLVLGIWVLVPGLFLTLLGVAGFVRQTRHRD